MPARDPLELRRYQPTVPDDLNDPPRLAQLHETAKDALVLELRSFFSDPNLWAEKRFELPTIEKYAIGFGTQLDPYQTFVQIYQEFPDVTERLPHIAITTVAGSKSRLQVGRPFVGHTQSPPRVVTSLAGPYALANPIAQATSVSLAGGSFAPGDVFAVVVDGVYMAYTVLVGDDANAVLTGIAETLTDAIGLVYKVDTVLGPSGYLLLTARTPGVAFAVSTSANLTAALVTASGNAQSADVLSFRSTPLDGRTPVVSNIVFAPSRFATSEPMSAVPPLALARVFNEQSLYAFAKTVPVGSGTGVQFENGGPRGFHLPNEIEVLSTSTPSLVAALGLGVSGLTASGDNIAGLQPLMTVSIAGGAFNAGFVGRYLVLGGATTLGNNGRFPIVAVPSATSLVVVNPKGAAETLPVGASWFVGARDDSTNPLRPSMNRYMVSADFTVSIDVLAESPNVRREVLDLLLTEFMFYLELKFFTLYGRGTFDEDHYPDEHYQVIVHQEVQDGGETDVPRGEDQKARIHMVRVTVPVTMTWYADRPVLVPSGPSVGRQWVLDADNVSQDPDLPPSS